MVLAVLARLILALGLFRLLGLPLARLAFPRLPAAAYALATTAGLVVSAHLTWLLCHAGMRLGALSVALGLAGTAALGWAARGTLRRAGVPLVGSRRGALLHHALFAAAFGFALLVTARNPGVDPDSERPMDLAMFRAVLASRTLPLEDPWLAGERVAYYDYGFYSAAYLCLFTGEPDVFFPIAVALLYPALLAGIAALGADLLGPAGAVLGGWLVSVGGNLDAARQSIVRGVKVPLDWFHGARVIEGSITEFPMFTLLWGDLHPYAIALPLWPPLLAGALVFLRGEGGFATVALVAGLLAALLPTNTWDFAPVLALLLLCGLVAAGRSRSLAALGRPALAALGGMALAAPFLVRIPVAGRGLARVPVPSTLLELVTAWGAPALVLLLAAALELGTRARASAARLPLVGLGAGMAVLFLPTPGMALALLGTALAAGLAFRAEEDARFPWALAAIGGLLVFGVELLYVDDWYTGDLERMNTVFKAYVEAWVLLQLAAALLLGRLLARSEHAAGIHRAALALGTGLLLAAVGLYPLRAIPARCGSLLQPLGLDARAAIRQAHPDDAAAIEQLKALPRGVIMESPGDPYTWGGRFASFTGYPAIVGWGHHEMGWRNVTAPITARMDEVRRAYAAEGLIDTRVLARQYGVRYVVVGALERKEHPAAALAKFETLKVAARAGATVIYEAPQEP